MARNNSDQCFEEVVEGSYMDYKCSPDIDEPDFLGIKINAAKVVTFVPGRTNPINGAFARVIVCGAYSFTYTTLGLNGDFANSIVLMAVDKKSGTEYNGTMPGVENAEPEPANPDGNQTVEDFAGDIVGGYFNPNLAVVMNLPEKEADYIVYAK